MKSRLASPDTTRFTLRPQGSVGQKTPLASEWLVHATAGAIIQDKMPAVDVAFSFDEAVRTMGVTPERLEKMIAEGKIATIRSGGKTLIPRSSILEYFGGVSALLPRDKKKLAAQKAE